MNARRRSPFWLGLIGGVLLLVSSALLATTLPKALALDEKRHAVSALTSRVAQLRVQQSSFSGANAKAQDDLEGVSREISKAKAEVKKQHAKIAKLKKQLASLG